MTKRDNRAAAALPMMWAELAFASWETIARRSVMMLSGTCSLAEYQLMMAEKLQAATLSGAALATGRTGAAAMAAVLRPWHSPAKGNAKRLRRK